jgi:hypothetical protein
MLQETAANATAKAPAPAPALEELIMLQEGEGAKAGAKAPDMIAELAKKFQMTQKHKEESAEQDLVRRVDRHETEKLDAEAQMEAKAQQAFVKAEEKHISDSNKKRVMTMAEALGESKSMPKVHKKVARKIVDPDAQKNAAAAKAMLQEFRANHKTPTKKSVRSNNIMSLFGQKSPKKHIADAHAQQLKERVGLADKEEYKMQAAMVHATSKRNAVVEQAAQAHSVAEVFGQHGDLHESLQPTAAEAKAAKQLKQQITQAVSTQKQMTKEELNRMSKTKSLSKGAELGESNVKSLFHDKKQHAKAKLPATDAKAVAMAKQQLAQQVKRSKRTAKKLQLGEGNVNSLFHSKHVKHQKVLPASDAKAVSMAKQQLAQQKVQRQLKDRNEAAVQEASAQAGSAKSVQSLFKSKPVAAQTHAVLSREDNQELAAQHAMASSMEQKQAAAPQEKKSAGSINSLFDNHHKKSVVAKTVDPSTTAAVEAQKSMTAQMNMNAELKQRSEAAVQTQSSEESIGSLFGKAHKAAAAGASPDKTLDDEEQREMKAQRAMTKAMNSKPVVKSASKESSITDLFGGNAKETESKVTVLDDETAAAVKEQKSMTAQMNMASEMQAREEDAVQVSEPTRESLFAGHATKPTKDSDGLPVWMSPEDKAQILASKRMQQNLLMSMNRRQESALQEKSSRRSGSKEDNMRAMFGQAPKQHAPTERASHQKAVSQFDKAVDTAQGHKQVWTLGEGHAPAKKKKKAIKKAVKPKPNKETLKSMFNKFVAKRTTEFNQLATKMRKKELFDHMQHQFDGWLKHLGEGKGEPQSDTDGGSEAKKISKGKGTGKGTAVGKKKPAPKGAKATHKHNKTQLAAPSHKKKQPSGMNVRMVLNPIGETVSESTTDKTLGDVAFDFNQESEADGELKQMSKLDKEKLMVNRLSTLFKKAQSN